jgi:hypothetical protein
MRLRYPGYLVYTAILIFVSICSGFAQSYGFGLKGGFTGATQAWESRSRANSLMLGWHVAAFIESQDNTEDKFSIFSQLGYHTRGSAARFAGGVGFDGQILDARTFRLQFNNISLALGGKRKYPAFTGHQWFYSLAVRGEYTLDYNLEIYSGFSEGVRRFNFGISVGTGYQLNIAEKVGIILELQVQPDFSRQVFVPPTRWNNPYNGQIQQLPEQNIRNLSVELSVGFRLLREIVYEDDYYE